MTFTTLDQLSHQDILGLEHRARKNGTAIAPSMLIGRWCPRKLWAAGQDQANALQSLVLNLLGAELLIENSSELMPEPLQLSNSVRIGLLMLRFRGAAWFSGRRPLLQFRFDELELRLGPWILFKRQLPKPEPRRTPFFALIGVNPRGWLLARGRGGGLALWQCQCA